MNSDTDEKESMEIVLDGVKEVKDTKSEEKKGQRIKEISSKL